MTRAVSVVLLALLATAAPAQDLSRTFTVPVPPPRDALDRLNLSETWRAAIPMDGRQDGLLSVQHTGRHLLVQTRSGLVVMVDAETGRTIWRTRVGQPYHTTLAVAFNSKSVFV